MVTREAIYVVDAPDMDVYTQELREIKRLLVECLLRDDVDFDEVKTLVDKVDDSNYRLGLDYEMYAMTVAGYLPRSKGGTNDSKNLVDQKK